MNSKRILILCLALIQTASSRPRSVASGPETKKPETEAKVREKRKYEIEIPFMRQLEDSGLGVKKNAEEDAIGKAGTRPETLEPKKPEDIEDTKDLELPAAVDQEIGNRVKKQSPNNIGGCGKTACGPVVSARGSLANEMRSMMQGGKPLSDLQSLNMKNFVDASKAEHFTPVHGRTFDTLMGLAPVSYSTPTVYTAAPAVPAVPAVPADSGYGHSFFKPQTIPAVALIPQPSHSLMHPMLLPHIMPHLMPSISSYFSPHRFEAVRLPEVVPADLKQPVPAYSPSSFVSADNTLLCTPYRNQRLDGPYDYVYKPDSALDKSLNVSDSSKKSKYELEEDERKTREHLRKVNEIKEEISQLNRAAQRIVDQQDRLTQMQQKQMYGGSSPGPVSNHLGTPYMGSGYYAYPGAPWGYSRANILSYPNSHDDIDFFLNLLRAGKKIGLFAESFQPPGLSAMSEALKGVQGTTSAQKSGASGNLVSGDKSEVADRKSNL